MCVFIGYWSKTHHMRLHGSNTFQLVKYIMEDQVGIKLTILSLARPYGEIRSTMDYSMFGSFKTKIRMHCTSQGI